MVSEVMLSLRDSIDRDQGQELLRGEADTFRFRSKESTWNLKDLREALPDAGAAAPELDAHGVPDYKSVTKDIIAHENELPDPKLTPRFNHKLFFSSLQDVQSGERDAKDWGNTLLYGDVVTSTNVLLEKYALFASNSVYLLLLYTKLTSSLTETPNSSLSCRLDLPLPLLPSLLVAAVAPMSGLRRPDRSYSPSSSTTLRSSPRPVPWSLSSILPQLPS